MDKGTGIFTQNTKRKSMILKHAKKILSNRGRISLDWLGPGCQANLGHTRCSKSQLFFWPNK